MAAMLTTVPPKTGAGANTQAARTDGQEHAFREYVERMGRHRDGRLAMQVHLSRLHRSHQRDHYLRIAIETFEDQVRPFEGQMFLMADNDIFFVGKNVSVVQLEAATERLRILFSDDPLIEEDADGENRFCTFFRVDMDYDALLAIAHERAEKADRRKKRDAWENEGRENSSRGEPVNTAKLAKLEETLVSADLSNLIRRQTVCSIIDGLAPQPLFEEIFVSISDLRDAVSPTTELRSNRWLFHHLTATLDRRVLSLLTRDGVAKQERPFSLNLNVATLLSTEFQKFDQLVAPQLRTRLVIELHKIDVFSDMGAFIFARDWLHDRGYRLCIDGLTHLTLPYINRTRLGFDLIKLFWVPDSICNLRPEQYEQTRQLVQEAGQSRVILCRCENEEAITVGQQLGIVMYQGRYIEQRLKNAPPAQIPPRR